MRGSALPRDDNIAELGAGAQTKHRDTASSCREKNSSGVPRTLPLMPSGHLSYAQVGFAVYIRPIFPRRAESIGPRYPGLPRPRARLVILEKVGGAHLNISIERQAMTTNVSVIAAKKTSHFYQGIFRVVRLAVTSYPLVSRQIQTNQKLKCPSRPGE